MLAIHALASGVPPRHKDRPDSGILQPKFLLVKHPLGGYGETVLRSGEKMEALSHCEIKVTVGEQIEGRIRGQRWEDTEQLLSKFKAALSNKPGPDGLVCEISASVDIPPDISADPDFWPRIVQLPNGNLLLRGRDPEELKRFAAAFTEFVVRGAPRDRTRWTAAEIRGTTTHVFGLDYDPQALRRIAAKIAYGMLRLVYGITLDEAEDRRLREYVLSPSENDAEPVQEAPDSYEPTTGTIPFHQVILGKPDDLNAVIVRLYGYSFRVVFESLKAPLLPHRVVLCRIDGSEMRLATVDEANQAIAECGTLNFGQPWRKSKQINSPQDRPPTP
jgi:hypothetical protein